MQRVAAAQRRGGTVGGASGLWRMRDLAQGSQTLEGNHTSPSRLSTTTGVGPALSRGRGDGQVAVQRARVLQGRASRCRRGKTRHTTPTGTAPLPQSTHGPSGQPGPLTLFEHSVPLLSALAVPDLPRSAWRAMFPLSCLSLREGRRAMAEGREESTIVPQPSWDVWTQADSQCQRENTTPSCPRS